MKWPFYKNESFVSDSAVPQEYYSYIEILWCPKILYLQGYPISLFYIIRCPLSFHRWFSQHRQKIFCLHWENHPWKERGQQIIRKIIKWDRPVIYQCKKLYLHTFPSLSTFSFVSSALIFTIDAQMTSKQIHINYK